MQLRNYRMSIWRIKELLNQLIVRKGILTFKVNFPIGIFVILSVFTSGK
jgi:hypothetical protein